MSDLSTVRTLISDSQQFFVSSAVGDGTTSDFQVPDFPIYPGTTKVYKGGALQVLDTDYTVDESLGLVSFVTPPTALIAIIISGNFTLLTDDQITEMLELNAGSSSPIRLAAADCLDAIASSQALIQKKIKLLDLQTDGPALAKALRDHASNLRKQVLDSDSQESDFDLIEMVYDTPSHVEKILKDAERDSA